MKAFFKGLAAAVAGGVINSITDAQVHRGSSISPDHLGNMAMTGAVLGCAAYLVGHIQGEKAGSKGGDPIQEGNGGGECGGLAEGIGEQKENVRTHPVN